MFTSSNSYMRCELVKQRAFRSLLNPLVRLFFFLSRSSERSELTLWEDVCQRDHAQTTKPISTKIILTFFHCFLTNEPYL